MLPRYGNTKYSRFQINQICIDLIGHYENNDRLQIAYKGGWISKKRLNIIFFEKKRI